MQQYLNFYINGAWVPPVEAKTMEVINPATETPFALISLGSEADVDQAVQAARTAFLSYSQTTIEARIALLQKIRTIYKTRYGDIAQAISMEMGAPMKLANGPQTAVGLRHLDSAVRSLNNFEFEATAGNSTIRHEPIGVCGLITPWNWPINQVVAKVAPALAAGCTMVLKPSEISPINAMIFAEVLDEAGVPPGVFNLVNGTGPEVGEAMSAHPDIDMMSFTGSARGGIAVAKGSANSVKRVCQELGGKSANIILEDADFSQAVAEGVTVLMNNSGQSCNAPSRMLVPQSRMNEVIEIARDAANNVKVGDPNSDDIHIGPVVSEVQFEKIQTLIEEGLGEGATLIAGGLGRPDGLETGYYVKPTVFADVDNSMKIAREEIFGPVLSILGYSDEEEAIQIANDTTYGLSGYVTSTDVSRAQKVANRIRAGQIHINYTYGDTDVPFGGYKQSGNGREKGMWGMEEYLEVKAIIS
ncbi:MAG: aldehyde dehydrogenase family protein [Chloroflexota bacterium]